MHDFSLDVAVEEAASPPLHIAPQANESYSSPKNRHSADCDVTHDLLYPTYGVCSAVVAMDTAVGQKAVRTLSECEADQNKRRRKDPQLAFWLERILHWFPELHTKTYFVPPVHFCRESVVVDSVAGEPVAFQVPVPGLLPASSQSPKPCTANGCCLSSQPGGAGAPEAPPVSRLLVGQASSPQNGSWSPNRQNAGQGRTAQHVDFTACCLWSSLRDRPGKPMKIGDGQVRDDRAQQHVLHCLRALADRRDDVMMVLSELKYENYLRKLRARKSSKASKAKIPEEETYPTSYSIADTRMQRGDFDVLIIHKTHGILVGEIKSTGDNLDELCLGDERTRILTAKMKQVVGQLDKAEAVLRHLMKDLPSVRISKTVFLPHVTRDQLLQVMQQNSELAKTVCDCLGSKDVAEAVSLCLCSDQLSSTATPWKVTSEVQDHLTEWWRRRVLSEGPDQNMSDNMYEQLVARSDDDEDIGTDNYCEVFIKQLNHTLAAGGRTEGDGEGEGKVYRHDYDLVDKDTPEGAAKELATHATNGSLYVIADEAGPDLSQKYRGRPFSDLCTSLLGKVPGLHMWAAAMRHGHKPDCLRKESLTIPLRCPPVVVREVEMAEEIRTGDVLPYVTGLALTAPTDGPRVRVLVHRGHKAIFPEYCVECGRATADVLMNDLHVGVQGVQSATGQKASRGESSSPPPLKYRDVLVLCPHPHTDTPFVRALRDRDLPVQIVPEKPDDDMIRAVALATRDVVTVSHWTNVHGLERKVIVGLAPDAGVYHRLQQMSRCTAQLICMSNLLRVLFDNLDDHLIHNNSRSNNSEVHVFSLVSEKTPEEHTTASAATVQDNSKQLG
ncbi:hypothetical protein C0Q70_07713 [Pomacea canaliculata]|uniref:Uncharacterized protein n=1 Tax=Pomacea canaliculata TaxID=400727 RepID=A0A2T7PFX4_POMCA|nr:hypothetical protein C0Q70_07713 [Pomacea canaliculata]